jgi:hypothetical protein
MGQEPLPTRLAQYGQEPRSERVPRDQRARRGRHNTVECAWRPGGSGGERGTLPPVVPCRVDFEGKRAWRAQLFMRFRGDFDGGQGEW